MSRTKMLRAKARKGLLDEAKKVVADLSMEELINLRHELGRQMNQQAVIVNDLRLRLDAVRHEITLRSEVQEGYRVTDHALVRYLERFKGVDIIAARREIAEIVRNSRGDDIGTRRNDVMSITLGVDETADHKTITTIFFDRELPVMKVPNPSVS